VAVHTRYTSTTPLRVLPSPELPYRLITLLKIEPTVAEELAQLNATEKASACSAWKCGFVLEVSERCI
jgi:hypothetical protein